MQATGATWTRLGTSLAHRCCFFSHLFIFSVSGDLTSSLSPSRSSPWCLASKRAQPTLEQVYMASESWALCQPQNPITIRGKGFTLEWIPPNPQQPPHGTGVP